MSKKKRAGKATKKKTARGKSAAKSKQNLTQRTTTKKRSASVATASTLTPSAAAKGKMQIAGSAKLLDPKLRRLLVTMKSPETLRADTARAFIASSAMTSSVAANESSGGPPLETCFKRVLIRTRRPDPPTIIRELEHTRIVDGICSVNIPIGKIEDISRSEGVEFIDAGREFSPLLHDSLPETRADEVHNPPAGVLPLDGQGVAVGIIDFGFDFTLDDFRNDDGTTRVAFFWDQSLTPQGTESNPNGFTHGVEYSEDDINDALNAADPFTTIRHQIGAEEHGTHVAGIAAGNGRSGDATFPPGQFIGAAPGATLILVQPSATDQTTSFTDSAHVAEAIRYVFDRADQLGLPCVINMSLGQNGGSHDGESIVERAVDRMLEDPGRVFVCAGGNEHIWRTHASGEIATGESHTLHWRIGACAIESLLPSGFAQGVGDRTPSELEIWYSSRDRFRVRVADPAGNQSDWFEQGEADSISVGSETVFIDSERFTVLNGEARIYIEVGPAPFSLITPGVWEVEIESLESSDGQFDAWIERDARDPRNRFRDQSFFFGGDFDPVKTVGTPATCRRGIVVANYNHTSQTPADSSGRGATRDNRPKPDVAAPGTNILSSNSLGGTDDENGNPRPMRVSKGGTSMAAPHVAGIAALMLQRDAELTNEQIRKMLIASARPALGFDAFDSAWGFGRVDARAAVDFIE